jgi:hypothetical protein
LLAALTLLGCRPVAVAPQASARPHVAAHALYDGHHVAAIITLFLAMRGPGSGRFKAGGVMTLTTGI